jgi:hypothetical protein
LFLKAQPDGMPDHAGFFDQSRAIHLRPAGTHARSASPSIESTPPLLF